MMIHKQQQEYIQQQQQQLEEHRLESELRERQKLELIKHKGKGEESKYKNIVDTSLIRTPL